MEIAEPSILLMKVGFHGRESLAEILDRKLAEEREHGKALWGYGGTLCHPIRVVQPFAQSSNLPVKVLLVETRSPFESSGVFATEWSTDGQSWERFQSPLVMDSKHALVIKNLRRIVGEVDLSYYQVAYGPSEGRPLEEYFRFRVDKAVARRLNSSRAPTRAVSVVAVADLVPPHAILVRH